MLFETYADQIRALPSTPILSKDDLLCDAFRMNTVDHRNKRIDVYYVPFEHINEQAKVVLVGITPGWTQMEIAYRYAREGLHDGLAIPDILDRIDEQASFAGSMRKNLIAMLGELELHTYLGIPNSEALFSNPHRRLLHTTSALRYPVFVNGNNYTGHSPNPLNTPALKCIIEHQLAEELARFPKAIIIPLGKSASTIIEHLSEIGSLDIQRCLIGFPHPSGANGHRICQFNKRQEELAIHLKKWSRNFC